MPRPLLLACAVLVGSVVAGSALTRAAEPIVLADFEGTDYGAWKTTGSAFGPGPAKGTLPRQGKVEGFEGRGLVNSYLGGDASTGTLTSPEFKIERRFITFLIGGGKDLERIALHLLVGGKIVRRATGPNDRPGGSEDLAPGSWDVSEFLGQTAVLRIVDDARGGWGHLNVDHLVQADRAPAALLADAKRDFAISRRNLHLPIKTGAPKRKVTLLVDGRPEITNDIELANTTPDWWAPMEVSAWRGRTVTLSVDRLPADSAALTAITQDDTLKDAASLYREPLRGQFHFSSQRGWNNDPNGLVFFRGEYHLFYQHNPYGWGWGNMHWGHAVSPDLVHWRELGDMLAPDKFGPMYSGSAVVDWKNTSGLGRDGQPPLVLLYTAAGNPTTQCLAYSLDGRSFTKFSGNPILPQITRGNRDPKVFWHEPTQKWVMVLYVASPEKQHTVHFFTSPNLREWKPTSVIVGGPATQKFLYECPDFFELPTDGDASKKRWVLTAADSAYAIGTFDGTTFTPEHTQLPGHRGRGFYAAQTFSDLPTVDGRRIQIGWFQTPTPGMPFNQSMTIPLELNLVSTPAGPRLTMNPVRELAALRARTHRFDSTILRPGSTNPLAALRAELVELRADFEAGEDSEITFSVRGVKITYAARAQEIRVNDLRAPAPLRSGRQRLTLYCDRTGLEIFASDGLTYIPFPFAPKPDQLTLSVECLSGSANFRTLEVHELKSIWPPRAP